MIELKAFSKYFHKGSINEVLALEKIDLTIRRGEFITIIGSNGAGKSTLLNCLAGTYLPDSGHLLLDGQDIAHWPEHRRARFISRVFQDPLLGTCASLSVEQNLALALRRGRRRGLRIGVKKAERVIFRQTLEKLGLGLEKRLRNRVGLLSGGQRQALTMLMATLIKPDILLLDEHAAALDPKTAWQILDLTTSIVSVQQITTLMVTHNMNHALTFGNRLIMLHRGKIIFDIQGEEKAALKKEDLIARFYDRQREDLSADRMLLG